MTRGWIATHTNGQVLHFSEVDGWTVHQVVGPFAAPPSTRHELLMALIRDNLLDYNTRELENLYDGWMATANQSDQDLRDEYNLRHLGQETT